MKDSSQQYQQFVELLIAEQLSLHRYLMTILGNFDVAATITQEANVVLLEKWQDFTPGTNFGAWARRVAYLQALAYLRDHRRERLVFSEATIKQIAQRAEAHNDISEERLALRHCLSLLSSNSLELIQQRYREGSSISQLAERNGKSSTALKVALHRIRRSLMTCIKKQLTETH